MSGRGIRRPGRMAIALALATLFLGAAAALFTLDALGFFATRVYSTPGTGTAFNVSSIIRDGTPLSPPPATPGVSAPISRLVIPRIKVDAPVVTRGVGPDGVMQVPDNAVDVAWYDFAARPGSGGNVVFSGHVDFRGVGPAVFWDLGKLEQGDVVNVALADGKTYEYRVTGKAVFEADSAPVDQIVGLTPVESVTLITCTGTFNPSTRQYDKRLVIRAELAAAAPRSPS